MDAHDMTMGFKKDGTQRKTTTGGVRGDTNADYRRGFSNVSRAA
jgi:hypothetical protein